MRPSTGSLPAAPGEPRRPRPRAGFSLMEILTAAVLLSFLIIPVVNLVLGSSTHIRRGAISTQALLLAQAHMETLLIKPFDKLEAEGQKKIEDGRFRRRVDVDNFEGSDDLKQIDVWIRWTDGASGKERALVLRTLRCRREGE